jgi:parvulin-like peptidyl-prolyl isomerase
LKGEKRMRRKILSLGVALFFVGVSFVFVGQVLSGPETILAKVGNVVITQKELDDYLSKLAHLRKDNPFTEEEKKVHLDNMVKGVLISMEAEREKLDQTPELKAKLNQVRRDLLLHEYVIKKIEPKITVTDKEIKEILKQNPNLAVPRELLKLKEILVKTEEEAKSIYESLKKGEDFTSIATQKSIAPTKIHGGHMKPLSRGRLPKELEEVAFSLKQGEFSKPIKTKEGYYLLYLNEREEKSPEEIEKWETMVREKIKKIEVSKKTQEMLEKKAEELKKNVKIDVYHDRIK